MTPGHSISVEPQFATGAPGMVHRWRCQCGRTGPWNTSRDRAVGGGTYHATAEAKRQAVTQ